MSLKLASYATHDVRFPTDVYGDGTDAMNKSCDHSMAYIEFLTTGDLRGQGMTFTIGRGNDIMCTVISKIADRIIGMDVEEIFADMGAFWTFLSSGDPQYRWLGPEKGVIHMANAAVVNALWDMYAKSRGKPLWKLIADFTPDEYMQAMCWRYVEDGISREEARSILTDAHEKKQQRIAEVTKRGYPAYTTSAGWLGYSDAKMKRLVLEALGKGFNHIKLKVGANKEDDLRRCKMVRSIIDDPSQMPPGFHVDPKAVEGKNAGPTGCVLMIDANQVWGVQEAIDYVTYLAPTKPWFIEEPTAPDDAIGHAKIRKALEPYGIRVATGEHTHNRMAFKNFFELNAMDICQLDAVRLAGFNEIMTVLLLAKKHNVPCCPHSGAVGLMNYHVHVSLIDYVCVSGSMDVNVLEYVDHHFVHEHFVNPVGPVNSQGRYVVPEQATCGASIEIRKSGIAQFDYPSGSYWAARARGEEVEKAENI